MPNGTSAPGNTKPGASVPIIGSTYCATSSARAAVGSASSATNTASRRLTPTGTFPSALSCGSGRGAGCRGVGLARGRDHAGAVRCLVGVVVQADRVVEALDVVGGGLRRAEVFAELAPDGGGHADLHDAAGPLEEVAGGVAVGGVDAVLVDRPVGVLDGRPVGVRRAQEPRRAAVGVYDVVVDPALRVGRRGERLVEIGEGDVGIDRARRGVR